MSRGWPEGSVGARQVKATSGHGGAEGPGRTDAPWRPALGADVHGNLEPRLGSAPAPGCHDRGAASVQTVGAAGRRLPELSALSPPFVWGSKIIPRRKGLLEEAPAGPPCRFSSGFVGASRDSRTGRRQSDPPPGARTFEGPRSSSP